MRVLLVTDWYPSHGGSEAYMASLRNGLRATGDDVRMLTSSVGSINGTADYVAFGTERLMAQALLQIVNPFAQELLAFFYGLVPPVLQHNLGKYGALKKAFFMNSLEGVDGDYLEFGVFTGSSMSAAMRYSKRKLRYFGFDSFEGFGELTDEEKKHPFFKDQNFKTDVDRVRKRLENGLSDKGRLMLVKGFFDKTLAGKSPAAGALPRDLAAAGQG